MAQAGYTPISLYHSTTASAAPTAGNLDDGELAINIADEKLYFKNSGGNVRLLTSSYRVTSVTTGATITPTSDSSDLYQVTALDQSTTVNPPSGTPTDGQQLLLLFRDDGTARSITWTTSGTDSYIAVGVSLPSTTVVSGYVYVGCIYNSAASRWNVIAVTST